LATETSSGLKVKVWLERLIEVREQEGRIQGPAFCDPSGRIARSFDYEGWLIERLLTAQAMIPGAISPDVDISEQFGISRSFCRGSTSMARTRGVDDKVVSLINRWRSFEGARGRHPTMPMHEHYSDISIMVPERVCLTLLRQCGLSPGSTVQSLWSHPNPKMGMATLEVTQ